MCALILYCLSTNCSHFFPSYTEDQQAMEEDEGIIVPLIKSNPAPQVPPQMPNVLTNRSHSSYYQSQNSFIQPMYPANLNTTPIAMMNYFNATHRQPLPTHPEHPTAENSFIQQQLHVDMVICLKYCR